MKHSTYAEIDLSKLENNYRIIKENSGSSSVMAVVKADAYGHGVIECSNLLYQNGVKSFAVANISEALELRSAFPNAEILILGFTPVEDADVLAEQRIIQTVYSYNYAFNLSQKAKIPLKVHLKLDTGMNRIGFQTNEEGIAEAEKALTLKNLHYSGVFTHFACADSLDKVFTAKQYFRFINTVKYLEDKHGRFETRHACNSAGIFEHPDKHLDMVRAGIILYGLRPSDEVYCEQVKPVMRFCSTVTEIHKVLAGETVGYGATFKADRDTLIATVSAGYADGYQRRYGQGGYVAINGESAPIAGRVCMDQFMVDITDMKSHVRCGDEVELFGDIISTDELAARVGTIGYELVCGIGKRVKRIYI